MTAMGKGYQSISSSPDFSNQAVGCIQVIDANEFPDFVKIKTGLRVENLSDYEPGGVWRAAALFSRK
jgi:hypothetical protein